LWLEWTIAAEVDETGQIAVAGKEWRSLVAGLTSPSVELEAPSELEMAGRMTMRFDGGEYKLPVLPAEEFPVPPEEVAMREPIQISGRRLAEALRKVMFAASTDPTMGSSQAFTSARKKVTNTSTSLQLTRTASHSFALKTKTSRQ
jgi:DNA polymerase III subunit beta